MNHYKWLDEHLMDFFEELGLNTDWYNRGIIGAHGDKCYGYASKWEDAGIPFPHGVAIYFLTYIDPWAKETRETVNGWVDAGSWVVKNYDRFKDKLAPLTVEEGKR